tara:strand:- start:1182 stop:1883 length:702 start_codon:yes stop_codon:yes gene_type:complete
MKFKKKNHLVILQARCSSKRLPNKVLMKINNFPLVVLSAKRLANSGSKVMVATSTDKSDNKLVKVLKKNKINYFRGSLENVLSRYQLIAKSLNSFDFIIRATSDNVLPDGLLIKKILKKFIKVKKSYWYINKKDHNFPKGLSLEIFTVKKILSLKKNSTKSEKEHVTKAIYKNKKKYYEIFDNKIKLEKKFSALNVSIDTKKDLQFVRKVFKDVRNPLKISYKYLLKKAINLK